MKREMILAVNLQTERPGDHVSFNLGRFHGWLWHQGNQLLNSPNAVSKFRFHRGGDAQSLMNPAVVVIHVVQGDHVTVIIYLFAESVCQASKAARKTKLAHYLSFVYERNVIRMCVKGNSD